MRLPRTFRLAACATLLSLGIRAEEPAILAKARSYLGTEAALTSVRAVRLKGTLTTTDPANPKQQTSATIEMISQHPDQHRITIRSDRGTEVTALDGYEAWTRAEPAAGPGQGRLTILGADQVKRLRANAWENLAFFRGLDRRGGRVEDLGSATVEGVTCRKVAFFHAPPIVFHRYFDTATGRLVRTETETGGVIREQGEWIVNGVRFPRAIVTEMKAASGQMQAVTITFDQITTDEVFPAAQFAVPSPAAR